VESSYLKDILENTLLYLKSGPNKLRELYPYPKLVKDEE
jgi:hypothetical protein